MFDLSYMFSDKSYTFLHLVNLAVCNTFIYLFFLLLMTLLMQITWQKNHFLVRCDEQCLYHVLTSVVCQQGILTVSQF